MAPIKNVINKLFYTNIGKIILSIILGLGLASLFRNICKGKNCYDFIGPKHNEITEKIFSFDSENKECYLLHEKNVKCGNKKQSISFA
jgi:hypothetical protein